MFSYDRGRDGLPPSSPGKFVQQSGLDAVDGPNDESGDKRQSQNDANTEVDENKGNDESIEKTNDDTISHVTLFRGRSRDDSSPAVDETVDENDNKSDDEHNAQPNDETNNENKLEFRDHPRDRPISPSASETERQLAHAVNKHKELISAVAWSATTYQHYHKLLHISQKQIFDLQAEGDLTGLAANARAEMEQGVRETKSHCSIWMNGERERWSKTLGEIKANKVNIDKLRREVEREAAMSDEIWKDVVAWDEDFVMGGADDIDIVAAEFDAEINRLGHK